MRPVHLCSSVVDGAIVCVLYVCCCGCCCTLYDALYKNNNTKNIIKIFFVIFSFSWYFLLSVTIMMSL